MSNCDSMDPCDSIVPMTNENRTASSAGYYRSSMCFRPLQQLYKTVYSAGNVHSSSLFNLACICRPSERYKTSNMTYGSFHYNNWAFVQKNRHTSNPCGNNTTDPQWNC